MPNIKFCWVILTVPALVFSAEAGATTCIATNVTTVVSTPYRSNADTQISSKIISKNRNGYFITEAKALMDLRNTGTGEVFIDFTGNPDMVGLPITIYAVQILVNNVIAEQIDLTNNCQSPGVSLFPNSRMHIGTWKASGAVFTTCEMGCTLTLQILAL